MIAVNNSHELTPFADALYAMDRNWWNAYAMKIPATLELWTTNREAAKVYRLNLIHGEVGAGICKLANTIRLGGNSGFGAVSLAIHFGARRIILLGFDMQRTRGRSHWHGDHKGLGNPVKSRFPNWARDFGILVKLAAERGCQIVNASRETALTIDRIALESLA